jgi:hypothetical protein
VPTHTLHLARHLRTAHSEPAWLDADAHARTLADADDVPLAPDAAPDATLVEVASRSDLLLSSTLRRGLETVARIEHALAAPGPTTEAWPELREARLPPVRVRGMRLPRGAWDVLARGAWFLGRSAGVESLTTARLRAARVVDRLEGALLAAGGTLTVVGHGCMNVLIVRELSRRGFRGPLVPSLAHGAVTRYQRG